MGDTGPLLKLEVELDGTKSSLDLKPGSAVVVGRKEGAEIRVSRTSVSQEHFQILWTGTEVQLKDLGSKFGTFRMPQDSPFIEASFPAKHEAVEFRISKSHLKLSWRVDDFVPEATEVLAATRTQALGAEVKKPLVDIPLETIPAPLPHSVERAMAEAARTQVKISSLNSSKHDANPLNRVRVAASLLVLASAFVIFNVGVGMGRVFLRPLLVGATPASPGVILDALALWSLAVERNFNSILSLFLGWLIFSGIFWRRALQGKVSWLQKERVTHLPARRYLAWLAVLSSIALWGAMLVWPLFWNGHGVLPPQATQKVRWLREWILIPSPPAGTELSARIDLMKSREADLKGSSLLYKALLESHRKRVLAECGGIGESSWENKKVCLVLLFAVSVEAKEEVKPVLLEEVSSRISILMSLDGMTRVLSAEGNGAPMIPFFLESLQMIGLNQERIEIETLVSRAKTPEELKSTIETLKELRKLIEQRLVSSQRDAKYPLQLRLDLQGPLELGI